jgi:hypothetical protein
LAVLPPRRQKGTMVMNFSAFFPQLLLAMSLATIVIAPLWSDGPPGSP